MKVTIITGPAQSGKTVYAKHKYKDYAFYNNLKPFEDIKENMVIDEFNYKSIVVDMLLDITSNYHLVLITNYDSDLISNHEALELITPRAYVPYNLEHNIASSMPVYIPPPPPKLFINTKGIEFYLAEKHAQDIGLLKQKLKIYVASSWRNTYYPFVVVALRLAGFEVYDFRNPPNRSGFGWEQINAGWKDWTTEEYVNALKDPIAEAGFNSDFDAMKWADVCVIVLPCGRSAHTELGWFVGQGKHTVILSPTKEEPELMYKMCDLITDHVMTVIIYLNRL